MKNMYAKYFLLASLVLSFSVSAVELRGRIDTRNPYNGYFQPLPRAEVALAYPNGQILAATYTGMDGFYYFYGIYPGNYILIINRVRNYPIQVPNIPGMDIPPVLF